MSPLSGELFSHLANYRFELIHVTFRWFNCIFSRELPWRCAIRLWDTYIADGIESVAIFHTYVTCGEYLLAFCIPVHILAHALLEFSFASSVPPTMANASALYEGLPVDDAVPSGPSHTAVDGRRDGQFDSGGLCPPLLV